MYKWRAVLVHPDLIQTEQYRRNNLKYDLKNHMRALQDELQCDLENETAILEDLGVHSSNYFILEEIYIKRLNTLTILTSSVPES